MTDVQILTLALTLLGIFAGSWFNGSRIGDVNGRIADVNGRIGDVNTRLTDFKETLRAEMKAMEARMDLQFERTNQKIDALLKALADIDQRVTALESRK